MQFSDTTNYQGIVQDIDWLLFGSSTATSPYAIADKTRNVNNWYDRAATLIMKADGRWEWDDNNKTDLPIATTTLTENQQDYAISGATFLKILKVEIKDTAGNWHPLSPISLDNKRSVSITDYLKTASTPREYDKLGNSIFLYPKPNYTQAASLKVFYQRNVTKFTAASTDTVPGFAENFHRYLSYGAALDYAIANGMTAKVNMLSALIKQMEVDIVDFYSNRGRDDKTTLRVQRENYGEDEGYDSLGNVGFTN